MDAVALIITIFPAWIRFVPDMLVLLFPTLLLTLRILYICIMFVQYRSNNRD